VRPLPIHADDERIAGGIDLAATLAAGRPVAQRGLLETAHGGIVLVAMAERAESVAVARLCAMLDRGEVDAARSGAIATSPSRAGVIALDEGIDDERVSASLADRLAFALELDALSPDSLEPEADTRARVVAARERLARVRIRDAIAEALCAGTMALGIASARASVLAFRAIRAHAAWQERDDAGEEDLAVAARLVLAPRATTMPAQAASEDDPADAPEDETTPPPEGDPADEAPEEQEAGDETSASELADSVVESARAALPDDLLAALVSGAALRSRTSGRAGAFRRSGLRGRPAGVRAGKPGANARLALVATLRAAVPWQKLRGAGGTAGAPRIAIRPDDLRVTRFRQRTETTTIFVVDASGSSALHRLAEAKGAVELMLAECYVRRDRVALVAFRGPGAELALPPTRSLVRAKRALAALPGGGGTPLASGVALAATVAEAVQRRGGTPAVVFLTDGGANVARDGTPGRARAQDDARLAARALRERRAGAILIDTSPRPQAAAREFALALDARYVALPQADAGALAAAVRKLA
jgi:magnesium chelatase subunit D